MAAAYRAYEDNVGVLVKQSEQMMRADQQRREQKESQDYENNQKRLQEDRKRIFAPMPQNPSINCESYWIGNRQYTNCR